MIWLILSGLFLGLLLILVGKGTRSDRGLTDAATLDLGGRVLVSRDFGLVGRADRLS